MDLIKIKDIIDKIKSNHQETNERHIKTLHNKLIIQTISPEEISLRFLELPSVILQWINIYQDKTTPDILLKAIQIVRILSQCVNGAKLFDKYGAIEFFYEFKNFLSKREELKNHLNEVEDIMRNIVQLREMGDQEYRVSSHSRIGSNQENHISSKNNLSEHSNHDNVKTIKSSRQSLAQEEQGNEEIHEGSFNYSQSINPLNSINNRNSHNNIHGSQEDFIRSDYNSFNNNNNNNYNNHLNQQRQSNQIGSSSFNSSLNQRALGKSFNTNNDNLIGTKCQQDFDDTIRKIQILERPKQTVLKEFRHLPNVELSESDDKFLFDIGVQLKFSEQQVQYNILTEILPNIIKDFPVEIFRRKNEIIQELVFIQQRTTNQLFAFHSIQNQISIIKKIVSSFKQVDSNVYQDLNISKAVQLHLKDDKQHIKYSQPSFKKVKINPDDSNALSKTYSGQWTFYQIIEFICSGTFENIKSNVFLGLICTLLNEITSALNYLRTINLPATISLVYEILSKFSIVIEQKRAEIYEDLSCLCLLVQIRNIFCILQPCDYQNEGSNKLLEQLYYNIFNPQLRCVYSKKQFEELYAYSDIFGKSNIQSDRKLKSLIESLEILKKFDSEISQYGEGIAFVQEKEYVLFVDNISKLVQALPFTENTKYPKLYLDTLIYTIAEKPKKPSGDLYYADVRRLFIQIAHIPTKLSHIVFQEFLDNLNRCDRHIKTKSGQEFTIQNIICQSLLDPFFASQLILAGLQKEENISLILQILHTFSTLYFKFSSDVGAIDHIYRFIPIFHQLKLAVNEQISKTAELLTDILRNRNEESWIHLITLELFSKDEMTRKKAYGILRNEQLLRNTYLQRDTTHFVARLLIEQKKQEAPVNEDILAPYLNDEKTLISYFDKCLSFNSKKNVQVNLEDITNLYQVIQGDTVDIKLKQAAVEQLIEKLTYLESKQYIQKEIQDLVAVLIQYAISTIETSPSLPLRVSMLGLLSVFLCNLKQFAKLRFQVFICLSPLKLASLKYNLLVNLMSQDKDMRYYSLKILYALSLSSNIIYYKNIEEKFNIASSFDQSYAHALLKDEYINFNINLAYKNIDERQIEIWRIYPLNQFEDYYVKRYLESMSEDALYQKNISDLQQEFVIYHTNNNISQQDYQSAFLVLLQWFDLYCGLGQNMRREEFFTGFVSEVMIKIFSSEYSQQHVQYAYTILKYILKQTDINEYKQNIPLNTLIHDLIMHLSTATLSQIYQIPTLHLKDKAHAIIPFMKCLVTFQKFIYKQGDPKLKHILTKKLLKQNFFDFMFKSFNAFPHNQSYFNTLVKFQTVLLDSPELLDFDLNSFMKYIMEQLLIMYKPSFEFIYKSKLKTILNFFLKYLNLFSSNFYISDAIQRTALIASKNNLLKASTLGWILKFTEDRSIQIRVLSWNILQHLIEPRVLKIYRSIVEIAIDVIMSPNEAFGVVICATRVLIKALEIYEEEADFSPNEEEQDQNNDNENRSDLDDEQGEGEESKRNRESEQKLEISEVMNIINGRNLITHIKAMIEKEGCPDIFYGNVIGLLYRIARLESQKTLALINQLELFDSITALLDNKFYRKARPVALSSVSEDKSTVSAEKLITVSLTCNFLTFILTVDKAQQNYLINGSNMLANLLKWLKIISNSYIQPEFQTSFRNKKALDDCVNSITKLLHTCIIFNEDITVFSINKRMVEKIKEKVTDSSEVGKYINIFRSLSYIIDQSKNDEMKRSCIQFIGQLLGGWREKGNQLIDSKDFNSEIIGENLTLQTYRQYKLLNHAFTKQELDFATFKQERNNILCALSGILSCSNYAKQVFVCCGFYQDVLKELYSVLDYIGVENATTFNVTTTKTTLKRKTAKESNIPIKYNQKPIESEDCIYYIRLFKALFCYKEESTFNYDQIMEVLQKSSHNLLEIFHKLLLLSMRKDDEQFNAFTKMLCNFSSHDVFSRILCLRFVDNRTQHILTEVQQYIMKLEGITKAQFKNCITIIEVLGQHEEIRKVYYRQKFIDSINQKFLENIFQNKLNLIKIVWNRKREWSPNNFYAQLIVHFLLSLSFYQDSHQKLFIEKQTFETLIKIVEETNCRGRISENIMMIMCNVSLSSDCKVFFTSKEGQIAAIMMSVLSTDFEDITIKNIVAQMFVNLLYKCNQAIIMFNKPQVVQQLLFTQSEIQRSIDKIALASYEPSLPHNNSQYSQDFYASSQDLESQRNIVANLQHIQQVLATVW